MMTEQPQGAGLKPPQNTAEHGRQAGASRLRQWRAQVRRHLHKGPQPDPKQQQDGEPEAQRGFDEIDRALGATTFGLLRDWSEWVHRRVEQISLEEAETHCRRVSVDFTLPRHILPARFTGDGRGIYFVPVTYLAKEPLVAFSMRDETGGALPILTRARNGALAASVLVFAAEAAVWGAKAEQGEQPLPPLLEDDLWNLARQRPDVARPICEALTHGDVPEDRLQHLPAADQQRERAWRGALANDDDFAPLAGLLASNFILAVPLTDAPGRRRILKYTFETHGDQPRLALPPPLGWLMRLSVFAVSGASTPAETTYMPFLLWVSRAIGWSTKAVKIETNAVSYGGSYHLEVEAPDGLQITRARLQSRDRSQTFRDIPETLQRVHLYAPKAAMTQPGGVAVIYLRSRESTLVRTAWLNAMFSTVLLFAVVSNWQNIVRQLGPALSLLFIVPALLSAYVARPREPAVTIDVMFGLRVLAASTALWQFAAALVLLAGTSCLTGGTPPKTTCSSWPATGPLLWAFVAGSLLTLLTLQVTLMLTKRPPEQRAGA